MLESISIDELKNKINIIDIRSIERYNNNHINGAINIPFEKLLINPSKYLSKNNIYYIYCQKGVQSKKACLMLKNMGYNVVNVNGGYESWIMEQ